MEVETKNDRLPVVSEIRLTEEPLEISERRVKAQREATRRGETISDNVRHHRPTLRTHRFQPAKIHSFGIAPIVPGRSSLSCRPRDLLHARFDNPSAITVTGG